jgi:3-oxoacyl-[acyl-carrier-protein] synthase II
MKNHLGRKRVVITGMGAICSLGQNVEEIWKNALAGKSGIRPLADDPHFAHLKELPIAFAGLIRDFHLSENILNPKEAQKVDRFIHLAMHATHEALTQANLFHFLEEEKNRALVGCILGVGMGGFPEIEHTAEIYHTKGHRRVSPFFIPAIIPNMATGMISIRWKMTGPNYSLSSACASSGHALGHALQLIQDDDIDICITGGAESVLSGIPISAFTNMRALSKGERGPDLASCPFSKQRDGFVMGEGSGILIIESLESALKRGAPILAEVISSSASSDAFHMTAPHDEGNGAIQCMEKALKKANLSPEKIDYINAHGTSTPLGDVAETKAIKHVFGEHAYKLSISSTKSMTGHLLGAAAGIESVFCIKSLLHQTLAPTINLTEPDPDCDLDYTPLVKKEKEVTYVMNNSFGFGGTNSCVIFKRFTA